MNSPRHKRQRICITEHQHISTTNNQQQETNNNHSNKHHHKQQPKCTATAATAATATTAATRNTWQRRQQLFHQAASQNAPSPALMPAAAHKKSHRQQQQQLQQQITSHGIKQHGKSVAARGDSVSAILAFWSRTAQRTCHTKTAVVLQKQRLFVEVVLSCVVFLCFFECLVLGYFSECIAATRNMSQK